MPRSALPAPGIYTAQVTSGKQIVIYAVAGSGNLAACIPVTLVESDVKWEGKHTMVLATADGEVKERNMETLRNVFPDFTEPAPFQLASLDLTPVDGKNLFKITGKHELYQPMKDGRPDGEAYDVFKIEWLNPMDGGMRMPVELTDADAVARWNVLFKAASKPSATTSKAAPPKSPAPEPEKKRTLPGRSAPVEKKPLTPEEVNKLAETIYDKLCEKYPKDGSSSDSSEETKNAKRLFEAMDSIRENHNGQLNETEWRSVAVKLGVTV